MSSPALKARVTEIFSSLQGEGPRIGERHIFIRFESCHMACAYCDESGKKGRDMTLPAVLRQVDALERKEGPHACVSLTGGEPLLQADFLQPLCVALRKRKYLVLLETSGVLWQQFSKVVRLCDIIAMDLKLASVTRQKDFLPEHRKFLEIAKRKEIYLKIVISRQVAVRDLERHLSMVATVAPETPVFLQPASSDRKAYPESGLMRLLDKLQRIGARKIPGVRVGIQLHKVMKIR